MGIVGLLPVLKSTANGAHVSKHSGQSVAFDAYCWHHKGADACSQETCEGVHTEKCAHWACSLSHLVMLATFLTFPVDNCVPAHRYVTYWTQRRALLCRCGVIPVAVFDGGRLPMTKAEEASRAR